MIKCTMCNFVQDGKIWTKDRNPIMDLQFFAKYLMGNLNTPIDDNNTETWKELIITEMKKSINHIQNRHHNIVDNKCPLCSAPLEIE